MVILTKKRSNSLFWHSTLEMQISHLVYINSRKLLERATECVQNGPPIQNSGFHWFSMLTGASHLTTELPILCIYTGVYIYNIRMEN